MVDSALFQSNIRFREFFIANNAVDHIPPDKRVITACLDVTKMQPLQNVWPSDFAAPMAFFVGNIARKSMTA